jgi:hypothetical protein
VSPRNQLEETLVTVGLVFLFILPSPATRAGHADVFTDARRSCLKSCVGACCEERCDYAACVTQVTTRKMGIVEMKDPGAWGTAMAVCEPHAQSIRVCAGAYEPSAGGAIKVVRATYGGNCKNVDPCTFRDKSGPNKVRDGNVTSHTASQCDGKSRCEYKVDYFNPKTFTSKGVIEDPCVGCVKDYTVEWHCGDPGKVKKGAVGGAPIDAGLGLVVTLSCP